MCLRFGITLVLPSSRLHGCLMVCAHLLPELRLQLTDRCILTGAHLRLDHRPQLTNLTLNAGLYGFVRAADLFVDAFDLGFEQTGKLFAPIFDRSLHNCRDSAQAALPFIHGTPIIVERLDNDHEALLLLSPRRLSHAGSHGAKDVQLGHDRESLPVLHGAVKTVAHDGDNHIEHRNLHEKCGKEEEEQD